MRSGFLSSKTARILSIVLVVQLALTYGMSRKENVAPNQPLSTLSPQIGDWRLSNEGVVSQEEQDVLKADELITRSYVNPQYRLPASLFVAYFRTQRTGQTPHSPKNCLPGNGWVQSTSEIVHVPIPGHEPIEANRYVVAKGESKSIVMYWYQSRDRTIASEYKSKIYSVLDSIRYNRSDIALVRVIVPVVGDGEQQSTDEAIQFIQSMFAPLRAHFPA